MFELTSAPIISTELLARLGRPCDGAVAVFEGHVRDHNLGLPVTHLEYEAFDELARAEGTAIVEETEQIHPGSHVLCVHRTGNLSIGETAVWIGVASSHRQTAFAACRHAIEELKHRLPIWKKEHHPGGAAEWVNCTKDAKSEALSAEYNARQIGLPEVGSGGQARLAAARVLLIGVGGLGCPAALYLAGAGIGQLTLVDVGKVERSNLHRQILFTAVEVGAPKALAAAARLRLQNPGIRVTAIDAEVTAGNVRGIVAGHDVVLDGADNFATRCIVHDACYALGVPLVSAAVHHFEGTLDVFRRREGGCLHCQWPDIGAAELDAAGRCAGGPVFGPTVGVLGVMQAAEALKLLLGLEGDAPRQTRLLNLLDGSLLAITRTARAGCPLCDRPEESGEAKEGAEAFVAPVLIDAVRLAALGPDVRLVHLTETGDPAPSNSKAIAVPLHDLARLRELAAQGPLVLTCRHGLRSAALARLLRSEGVSSVYALTA